VGTEFFSLTIKAKSNIIVVLSYLVTGTILFGEDSDSHLDGQLVSWQGADFSVLV
jgi:hypothetical protein